MIPINLKAQIESFRKNVVCKNESLELQILKNRLESTTIDRDELKILYERCKRALDSIYDKDDMLTVPSWLNTSIKPYSGKFYTENGYVDVEDPRMIFSWNRFGKSLHLEGLHDTLEQKLYAVWRYVVRQITYKYDVNEDWQTPYETLMLKTGDCEDTSSLFVTIAHKIGIKDVWLVCGWYQKKFGHAYVVARHSDGYYYIYETTLDFWHEGLTPVRLDQQEDYDDSWGWMNQYHMGRVMTKAQANAQKPLFESLTEGKSNTKMRLINNRWLGAVRASRENV